MGTLILLCKFSLSVWVIPQWDVKTVGISHPQEAYIWTGKERFEPYDIISLNVWC